MMNSDNGQGKDEVVFPTSDNNPAQDGDTNPHLEAESTTPENGSALSDKVIDERAADDAKQDKEVPEEDTLDDAIEETFPASDPISVSTKKSDDTQT
jgi:hypothetical protein